MVSTDHAPFYRDMVGMHSWKKNGAGSKNKRDFRGPFGTGGDEKDRFTVQFSIAKDGTKLTQHATFKGAPFDRNREHHRRTVTNDMHERLDD